MVAINPHISYCDKNYSCGWGYPGIGAVMVTSKTLEGVKREFAAALAFHIEGRLHNGDPMPQRLLSKDYRIEWPKGPIGSQ
ncbi:MAG: hypothetical protein LUD17_01575 [Bacteroidales bacterium]|nr:hypothetical protein [Bacteroidales bacterium]